jgi:flagellar motor switch protein FliG
MRVGLYRDLAVGADRGGSEIWSHPERFADRVSIGAPPDLLAPKGQNWGLPAFDPHAGAERRRGGLGELPVGEVLQPRVVADQFRVLRREAPHRPGAGATERLRPVAQPLGALLAEMLGQRLEHGVGFEILAAFLRNEYPQTVAVVLSKVRSDYAAKVLTLLPEEFAIDVLNRMLRMETVQKEALRHIEETLRVEFVATIAQSARRDAHEMMADVFNAFDRQTEGRFLAALDQGNRGSAKRIRELMFTFEDLLKLDPGSVQTLMRSVDNETLCRALKGADERVRGFFLAQMSTRAAKNLTDEMASLGPVRLKEVDEAQTKMTEIAKDLAEKGEIMIAKNSAEEELVY